MRTRLRQHRWTSPSGNFNLVPSDFLHIYDPSSSNKRRIVAVFAHIDRGDAHVDHHTFFMSTNATSHVHHCSFEVHDYDTQMLGHQWPGPNGYRSAPWGVGRHILGSQIFDHWWDPHREYDRALMRMETRSTRRPHRYLPAGNEALAVWRSPKCDSPRVREVM